MNSVLDLIVDNNAKFNRESVKRALIIYEDDEFFLGDTCIILYKIGLFKYFFGPDVSLDINFITNGFFERYKDLCKNNPNLSSLLFQPLKDLSYEDYDVIICVSLDEEAVLRALELRYPDPGTAHPGFAVCSLSKIIFFQKERFKQPVFPFYEALSRYASQLTDPPCEIYISPAEKEWGNKWLEANGINKNEQLFVIIDNASNKEKLLSLDTYYEVLQHLLNKENVRILIFDEKNWGKELFYREWLGDEAIKKFIFSKGLRLREDLCILGSDYTKFVFGPCTGLLHCASGIYNNFISNGFHDSELPVVVVYTGPWDAEFWWGASPRINCLLLKKELGQKKMIELKDLGEDEKRSLDNRLNCGEYTSGMLTGYIDKKLAGIANLTTRI